MSQDWWRWLTGKEAKGKAKALVDDPSALLLRSTVAAVAFFCSTALVKLAAGRLGISSAHRGEALAAYAGLAGSSVLSVLALDAVAHKRLRPIRDIFGPSSAEQATSIAGVILVGIACFHALGGKYYSLLPSDYASLGAFRHSRGRTVAGLDYADAKNRGAMDLAGRLIGCHTCGTRRALAYIADHQPPLKFVKRANQTWYRRLALGPMAQEFYPQCKTCSNIQSQVVRMEPAKRPLNYHWSALRAYDGTGLALGFAWSLYAGVA